MSAPRVRLVVVGRWADVLAALRGAMPRPVEA